MTSVFSLSSSSVSIVTKPRIGRAGVWFPAGAVDFYLLKNVQTGYGAQPASSSMSTGLFFFLGVKRPGHEFDHIPPSAAEVKNEWSYTSAPPVYLHGVDRDNLTLTFTECRSSMSNWVPPLPSKTLNLWHSLSSTSRPLTPNRRKGEYFQTQNWKCGGGGGVAPSNSLLLGAIWT
jgi:hypothetical protein